MSGLLIVRGPGGVDSEEKKLERSRGHVVAGSTLTFRCLRVTGERIGKQPDQMLNRKGGR